MPRWTYQFLLVLSAGQTLGTLGTHQHTGRLGFLPDGHYVFGSMFSLADSRGQICRTSQSGSAASESREHPDLRHLTGIRKDVWFGPRVSFSRHLIVYSPVQDHNLPNTICDTPAIQLSRWNPCKHGKRLLSVRLSITNQKDWCGHFPNPRRQSCTHWNMGFQAGFQLPECGILRFTYYNLPYQSSVMPYSLITYPVKGIPTVFPLSFTGDFTPWQVAYPAGQSTLFHTFCACESSPTSSFRHGTHLRHC
jgi:hypothetical protein